MRIQVTDLDWAIFVYLLIVSLMTIFAIIHCRDLRRGISFLGQANRHIVPRVCQLGLSELFHRIVPLKHVTWLTVLSDREHMLVLFAELA